MPEQCRGEHTWPTQEHEQLHSSAQLNHDVLIRYPLLIPNTQQGTSKPAASR